MPTLSLPPHHATRRQALQSLWGWAAAPLFVASDAQAGQGSRHLRLLGTTTLPHRMAFQNTTVGGLSALDYDPVEDLWYALSDDRSDINPSRFYTFRMTVSPQGLGEPELQSVVMLRQADGSTYPNRKTGTPTAANPVADPEGLRFRPQTRTLLWSSEGDPRLGLDPFVREISLNGRHQREFALPPHLKAVRGSATTGPRDNLGFEGLAISPNGLHVWAAMEGPLLQDGPVPTVGAPGGPCRFTCFSAKTGEPIRQIAYIPDAIPRPPLVPGTYADNGVSEILMQTDTLMLVLERSYSLGTGNSLRVYQIDISKGSDTLMQATLQAGGFQAAPKTLLADLGQTGLARLDNTEGMAWGPALPGHNAESGRRTLVCISDDNFNPAQITQLAAFEFTP